MGTLFRVIIDADDHGHAQKVAASAFSVARELESRLSDYHEGSELMQLCKKPIGEEHEVGDDLYKVLEEARDIYEKSGGAFDVAVGHLTKNWRRAGRLGKLPDTETLNRCLASSGMAGVELGANGKSVTLLRPGLLLDLGGIAKGYAADRMLASIEEEGYPRAAIVAGGDILVGAAPRGRDGWEVAIRPFGMGNSIGTCSLHLSNAAVSTSGSVYQYVSIDGRKYSHIIDPRSGIGIDPGVAVTVVAPRSVVADSMATTLCIMGESEGLELASEMGVEAMVIRNEQGHEQEDGAGFRIKKTTGFPLVEGLDDGPS